MATLLEEFLFKIRRGEGRVYSQGKKFILNMMNLEVPSPRLISRFLFSCLLTWRFLSGLIFEKVIFVPVFKGRCEKCGKHLKLPNGIPWIEGNMVIRLGDSVTIDGCAFSSGHTYSKPELTVGDRSFIGFKTAISVAELVRIGNDCMIAGGCYIADNDGHPLDPKGRLEKRAVEKRDVKPVILEDNVWIGTGSVILKGVTIGKNSIVAANSLLTRAVPPNTIVMGIPAKIVLSGIDRVFAENHEPKMDSDDRD